MQDRTADDGGRPTQLTLWAAPSVPESLACRHCGVGFERRTKFGPRPLYCSQPCKDRAGHPESYAKPPAPQVCPGCGVTFVRRVKEGGGPPRVFCTSACGKRTRVAKGEPTRLEPRACDECGAVFAPITGFYQSHAPRRYCSAQCAGTAAAGRRAIREATGVCRYCQSPFKRPTNGNRAVLYCSEGCGVKARYPGYIPKYQDRFEPRACPECGRTFTTGKSGPPGRYCSPSCRAVNGVRVRKERKRGVAVEVFSRRSVYERDGWQCGICRAAVDSKLRWPDPLSASLDHLVPVSKGGGHVLANVQLAHLVCNLRKGNMMMIETKNSLENGQCLAI